MRNASLKYVVVERKNGQATVRSCHLSWKSACRVARQSQRQLVRRHGTGVLVRYEPLEIWWSRGEPSRCPRVGEVVGIWQQGFIHYALAPRR